MKSPAYTNNELVDGDGRVETRDMRKYDYPTTAVLAPAHAEKQTTSLKPHKTSTPAAGKLGIKGQV